ncbi:MAG TPA: hypothetical protein VFD55_03165 [Candidatus Angelobacter sp.]|nr:hypothetical protein [Candidatus Angelobacter sp.]
MKKPNIKAASLRTFMSFIIFIMIGSAIVGFYYAQDWLSKFANEVSSITTTESTKNEDDAQALNQLKNEIATNQTTANKAASMIASTQNYQTQVTQDLDKYASNTGISITDYGFEKPAIAIAPLSINGVQQSYVTITLKNPVKFTNLIKFIKSIESNTPKMQLTGVNLNYDPVSDNDVTTEPLVIEVYTR